MKRNDQSTKRSKHSKVVKKAVEQIPAEVHASFISTEIFGLLSTAKDILTSTNLTRLETTENSALHNILVSAAHYLTYISLHYQFETFNIKVTSKNFIDTLRSKSSPEDIDVFETNIQKLNDFYSAMKIFEIQSNPNYAKLSSFWNLIPLDVSSADNSSTTGTDSISNESPENFIFQFTQSSDDVSSSPKSDDTEEYIPEDIDGQSDGIIDCKNSCNPTDSPPKSNSPLDPEIAMNRFFYPPEETDIHDGIQVNINQDNEKQMSTLCYKIAEALQDGPKTPKELALETNLSRQRICTALSVYRAIGLIKSGDRKSSVEWDKTQALALPKMAEHAQKLLDLREKRQQLEEIERKMLESFQSP